jgi:hypothetical protein
MMKVEWELEFGGFFFLFQCQQITYKKTRFRILALFIPFSSKLKISHASRIRAFLIVMMMMDAGMGKREREKKEALTT